MNALDSPGVRRIGRTVTTPDGVHVAGRDHPASAEEATAVLLHRFCLDQNSWNGQRRCLLLRPGSRMRLNTHDRRGYGQSSTAPSHTHRAPTLADDLHSVLTAPHVRTPLVLVGHSMGAMTALTVAGRPATDQAVPSYGLVLVATAAGRRLTEPGTGRLLAIPADGVLPTPLGHVPDHALRDLAAPVYTKSAFRRDCAPAARYFLAAAATSAMASTPLTTALGFLPALHDHNAYPSWPPSSRAPSSYPAAPMRSPHRHTPRTWPPAPMKQSTLTYSAQGTCSLATPPWRPPTGSSGRPIFLRRRPIRPSRSWRSTGPSPPV
jgi:pimeloyl-ACP methyl ester carboxylesterase